MSDIQEVYNQLLKNGFSDEDLQDEIKKKEREFHGFITKGGALFLIAKEQGIPVSSPEIDKEIYGEAQQEIDYNEFLMSIAELRENMTNLVLLGKIVRPFPLKEFIRKDGTPSIFGSFLLSDGTGLLKVLLWNDQYKIMESEFFTIGKIIRIINGYVKKGLNDKLEVHVSKKSKVLLDPDDIPKKIQQRLNSIDFEELSFSEYYTDLNSHKKITISDIYEITGFINSIKGIVKNFELKEFKHKLESTSSLLTVLLSDETAEIQVNFWNMKAIELLRIIEKGIIIHLFNVFIKENKYTHQKELQYTKKSRLEII